MPFTYAIVFRINPIIWLPSSAAILHYSETFMLSFIVTPKAVFFTVSYGIVSPMS